MNRWNLVVTAGAMGVIAGAAMAAPVPRDGVRPMKSTPSSGPVLDNPFSDNFDSYTAGSGIAGQGGWQLWEPTSPNAWVDNAFSSSSPNSLRLDGESDVVQLLDVTTGKWRFTADTYFPSSATADGYLIALNTFPYVGIQSWSLELQFGWVSGMVSEYASPVNQTPAVRDQWVPVVVEVDLDTDMLNVWYNNVQVVIDRPWSSNIGIGGAVRIQCWDLYSAGAGIGSLYYDNINFEEVASGCYANCDESTTPPVLNVDDFTCFINQFAAASQLSHAQQITHYANCDGSTTAPVLNVDDFTCFINEFAQGCP